MNRSFLTALSNGLVLTVLVGCGCREQVVYDTPIPVDDTFERVPATGDALARYEAAAAYSEAHGGRAFMVLEGDTVVFETGQNGHSLAEPHHLYSGTKSFSCALFGALRQDGVLSEDQSVLDTIPELADTDPDRAALLTVDHLLHLTGGKRQPLSLTLDLLSATPRIDDKYTYAVELGWKTDPGEVYAYGPTNFLLFGELVRRTAGDPLDVLDERVFDPIGMRYAGWIRDGAGNPALSAGAFTTANEWAKFGVLARDDGEFLGQQILEPGSIHDCFEGSEQNPAYGHFWWLNQDVGDDVQLVAERALEEDGPIIWNDGPADLVAAAGHDDQRLYVVPSEDLVVVRLSNGHRNFKDAELLKRIFGE